MRHKRSNRFRGSSTLRHYGLQEEVVHAIEKRRADNSSRNITDPPSSDPCICGLLAGSRGSRRIVSD
jgi:hypothetical protein